MFEPIYVPRFDGGLNFTGSPAMIQDHEWTWSDGFEPSQGCALQMSAWKSKDIGTWPVAGTTPIGMVEDGLAPSANRLFLFARTNATGIIRVWRWDAGADTLTEQTVSGTWKTSTVRHYQRAVIIGGKQLFCLGASSTLSDNSCASFADGSPGTATVIAPTTPLRGYAQAGVAGHAIVSGDLYNQRLVHISDANLMATGADWNPAISNSADEFSLDAGQWRGMAMTTQGVVIVYDTLGFLLQPTGGDPPFSTSPITTVSSMVGLQQITGEGPFGIVFLCRGGYRELGGGVIQGSEKCSTLVAPSYDDPIGNLKLMYDKRRSALVATTIGAAFGYSAQNFFRPDLGAWFRRSLPAPGTGIALDAAFASRAASTNTTDLDSWLMWTTGDLLYYDDYAFGSGDGHLNAFVDTKDFSYPSPSNDDYWDEIQVDVEKAFTPGSVDVYAYIRNELFPTGFSAKETGETDYTAQFVSLGTLSYPTNRLRIRKRGRYGRFRFQCTLGQVRIRGFKITRTRGTDRYRP